MLWIELTEVLGITNNQTWNWKRKKQKMKRNFPSALAISWRLNISGSAAPHAVSRDAGATMCIQHYLCGWPDKVIYDRQVLLTWIALLDCSMKKRRGYGVLLEDLQGSTRRSDLSVSLQMYTSKVGILRNWDIMKLQVSWKSFLFCSVHEKYTEYTISADLYSSRVITDSA